MFTLVLVWLTAPVAWGDDAGVATVQVQSARPGTVVAHGTVRGTEMIYEEVCETPCTIDLTPGFHRLLATGPGQTQPTFVWDFEDGTTVLGVKTGSRGARNVGVAAQVIGWTSLVAGSAILATQLTSDSSIDPNGALSGGLIGGGAVLGVAGVALVRSNRGRWMVRATP